MKRLFLLSKRSSAMGKRLNYLQDLFASLASRVAANTPMENLIAERPAGFTRLASLCATLMTDISDSKQLHVASEAFEVYRSLDSADKARFFQLLMDEFAAAPASIHEAYARYRADGDDESLQHLSAACEPRRLELLRRLNRPEGGTLELVKMRADLLLQLRDTPELKMLDADFLQLLKSWFNRGFLTFQRLDWSTPAQILEKIIQYEAVHEIPGWDELRNRMKPEDRRCYAFFHPAVGFEPLIFVEVALSRGIPGNIEEILSGSTPVKPAEADTAVFYSISNCQPGLTGIAFGNFLIKQVAEQLKSELPTLKQFVTLSPVPRLSHWLANHASTELPGYDAPALSKQAHNHHKPTEITDPGSELQKLGAYYLCHAKASDGKPYDPVARFHLGNGASLYRINWPGNCSEKGLQQSLGIMANYIYDLDKVEANYHDYTNNFRVPCSDDVAKQAAIIKQYKANNMRRASSV